MRGGEDEARPGGGSGGGSLVRRIREGRRPAATGYEGGGGRPAGAEAGRDGDGPSHIQ
ncbi:hypothetical protein [Oryza sativa Japonica Group]|uniref:Uncharacterized protein n=1 Tax=Oryza sativa subsp. japonica TaxID=39947 RepID=Q93WF3_ORYSJ|nr:hypothetical protein [Oryza sativa Japonica Group]BAB64688.1 hypothetical protein [Oryza sativa Japonica Group]